MTDMSDRIETEEMEVIGPAEEPPDFSDVAKVIFSIETKDGQQFSLVLGTEPGKRLSLMSDHEGDYVEIVGGDGYHRTIFRGDQAWEFIIRLEEVE